MARIGRLPPSLFGPLPIVASPPGYRLRSRFHVESREGRIEVGAFAPRTHRVERLDGCLALTESGRALLPSLRHALNPEEGVSEIATVESLDGSRRLARVDRGARSLGRPVGGSRPALRRGPGRRRRGTAAGIDGGRAPLALARRP